MRMMITTKCKRRVRLIEQDLCEDQSMNMGAEYTAVAWIQRGDSGRDS